MEIIFLSIIPFYGDYRGVEMIHLISINNNLLIMINGQGRRNRGARGAGPNIRRGGGNMVL